jgi:phage terminase large subunit-like protein
MLDADGDPERPAGAGLRAEYDEGLGRWTEAEFWFDEAAAEKAVAFFADYLCFTKGEWSGRPSQLEAWQADDIIRPLFGWKRLDDNTRRYRRCFVWVPRKNGKTELAAGIALLALVGDAEDGGEVYAMASHKDQARIVFDQASSMVAKSNALAEHMVPFKTSIYCPSLNASFKPLTGKAEGKHGLNAFGLIGDEVHE